MERASLLALAICSAGLALLLLLGSWGGLELRAQQHREIAQQTRLQSHVADILARDGSPERLSAEELDALTQEIEERRAALVTVAESSGQLAVFFMIATALFGSICIASFAWIHRRIARAIGAVIQSVEDIGRGKTYLRVPADGRNELAALAAAINRLLDAQADAMNKIEEQRQQIRQQTELMRVAGEIALLGGWSVTLGDERVRWSSTVAEIHGEAPGFSPTVEDAIAYFRGEDSKAVRDAFVACVSRGTPYDLTVQLNDTAGRARWVRTAGIAMRDDSGRIIGVQGALQDISRQVDTELGLGRAQRLESIGQLTGGIAHDFNNILTVILGNAELLADDPDLPAAQADLARTIQKSAERGAQLTHQLLAFARRQTLHPEAVDLCQMLEDLRSMLDRSLGEDIVIETRFDAGLWPCRLDRAQMENAVLNLALNARDAMPEGGTLTLATQNTSIDSDNPPPLPQMPDGDYVRLSVKDTGQGIAESDMGRLFEPFFTTKEKGRGTGLGLPMVYGFVSQSQGFIHIRSTPGVGTQVDIYLPRSADSAVDTKTTARRSGAAQPRTEGDWRVLLVEDDTLVRRYVEQQLRSLGYRVVSAGSGPEALTLLQASQDIDILFTDIVMPGGMSGRELAEAALAARPDLRVLYTSGYARDALPEQDATDRDIPLLRKPYHREELALALHTLTDA
jgi:signal transduction histidine kinase